MPISEPAPDWHDFMFDWFNERYCYEMARCLQAYGDASRNPVTGAPLSPREQFEAESG